MTKMSSKLMWFAGGPVLFAAAFFGVAMAKGVALREVPPLSWMPQTQAPTSDHTAVSAPPPLPAPEPRAPVHANQVIPPLTAGVLGAFVMPSPYDARELHDLEKSLKDGLARVAADEERQKKRERELDDWQNVLEQRAQELSALRKSIDESGGTAPGEKPVSAKSAASWRAMAPLFEEGDPSDVAVRLAELEPDQAAQVLRGLDADRAAAILNALPKERYKTFLDAWRRAGG
jgi:flagellar motility protein MotE (MotC chaperone)